MAVKGALVQGVVRFLLGLVSQLLLVRQSSRAGKFKAERNQARRDRDHYIDTRRKADKVPLETDPDRARRAMEGWNDEE